MTKLSFSILSSALTRRSIRDPPQRLWAIATTHRCHSDSGSNILHHHNHHQQHQRRPSYCAFESRRYGGSICYCTGVVEVSMPDMPRDDPKAPPSKLKDPTIPEGHPIDTDGTPLGHFIPDYDVELPAFSFGGYAKDFEAWTDPPVFPPTLWPQVAKYDYEELVVEDFPTVYEINMVYALYVCCLLTLSISIIGTRFELNRYYSKNAEFYTNGWPHFHYDPALDMVPLTAREDGLPPETLILQFGDEAMIKHELEEEEKDDDDDDNDDE